MHQKQQNTVDRLVLLQTERSKQFGVTLRVLCQFFFQLRFLGFESVQLRKKFLSLRLCDHVLMVLFRASFCLLCVA